MSDLTSEERLVEQLAKFLPRGTCSEVINGRLVRDEFMPLILSHTNALVAAAYGACAKVADSVNDTLLLASMIRSLTPADAAQELERRLREAERKGREGMMVLIPSRDNKRIRTLCIMKNGTYHPLEIIPAPLADEIEQRIADLSQPTKETT